MSHANKKLHELEEQLIQIIGLLQALQQIMPDGSAHTCVANELESRLRVFKKQFYESWDILAK